MGHSSLLVTCLTVVLEILGLILSVGSLFVTKNIAVYVYGLGYGLHILTAVLGQLSSLSYMGYVILQCR